ncbi:MAG TPA: T9SS type A sorting domain-containing protein [Bacteroidia bacterium]|nr:T9SS type A sorting domain-containing protein [Bacteroidia bacterium]
MKNATLFIALVAASSLFATTRTSIQSGVWTNPAIWIPNGVPDQFDDTIIVNTDVQFNENLQSSQSLFRITPFGSLTSLSQDTFSVLGGIMIIEGYFRMGEFDVAGADSVINYSAIVVDGDMNQNRRFVNTVNGQVCVDGALISTAPLVNHGSMSAGSWNTAGAVSGNGGQFCVQGSFANSGAISGSIDICDASPSGVGDSNTGTIAGSVTICQVGPCGQCVLSSVVEYNAGTSLTIIPHPVTSSSLIQVDFGSGPAGNSHGFELTDITGRVVKSIVFVGDRFYLDRTGIESGVYFYQVTDKNNTVIAGKLLIE